MNDVPVLFSEAVCSSQFGLNPISECRQLSGLFGEVASDAFDNAAFHVVELSNGQFCDKGYFSQFIQIDGARLKFKKVTRKHHMYTGVFVAADSGEYSIDPSALEELSAATKSKQVSLGLHTLNLSKELEKWIGSIQSCFGLKVAADIPRIPDSLIQKKTLIELNFGDGDNEISDEATSQVLELLKQDQFIGATLSGFSVSNLSKLISGWNESANRSKMTRKDILCRQKCNQQTAHDLGFRKCTEEEKQFTRANAEEFFVKIEGNARVYCILLASSSDQTLLIFA